MTEIEIRSAASQKSRIFLLEKIKEKAAKIRFTFGQRGDFSAEKHNQLPGK